MKGVIEGWDEYRPRLEEAALRGHLESLRHIRIRPPLPNPANIICMAVNYMEDGTRSEPPPINAFNKAPGSIIGQDDTMILPDIPATVFEGEAEMALVMAKRASHVSAEDAMDYIFGYINFIDGSARGLPPGGFYMMKSLETFAPIGPFLVTRDEIPDPQRWDIKLWNNGQLMQSFNTDDMAHGIRRCVEWVSSIHPLEAGDILATGTNHRGLNPFMDGDVVELETEGLGRLKIKVRDDLKRTWDRVTRLQMQESGKTGTPPQTSGKYA
jgi:2-keto-4-pentenoate hydratase/2-oxohepta-3-ene-1,7-dioic acid hydratase in catechol pathway